ncbi:MAG: GntR family transcriptional regulator [Muribaculaceae bacterium]|nr:GntR family transcriptional regulator [Muribaculaceae bacterium]
MNFKENKPIYQQIADHICDEIIAGKLAPDARIPSVREYAAELEVNANTVMRTFDTLQSLEIIYNKRGIGYFVDSEARAKILQSRRNSFMEEESQQFFRQAHSLGISVSEITAMYQIYCNNQKKH